MKKCNQCGATVNDSALFCTVCGCRLSANDDVSGTMPSVEDDFDSGATTVLNDNPYAQSQPIKNESTVYTPQPSSNYFQQNPNNYRNPAPQQSSVNYAQGGQAYGNFASQQQYQNPNQQANNNPYQQPNQQANNNLYQQPNQPAMGYVPNAKKNPFKAYADFWKNYANFNGRARRSDYWYVVLVEAVVGTVFGILAGIIMTIVYNATWDEEAMAVVGTIAGGIMCLYSLATIVPHLSLAVRRLHDTGKGGVYLLLGLIPGGNIIILVFCCTDSQPGINQYGTSEKYPQLQQNNIYAQQGMYR